jgi:hypothetical protein
MTGVPDPLYGHRHAHADVFHSWATSIWARCSLPLKST